MVAFAPPARSLLIVATVVVVIALMPGCGLRDDEGSLGCTQPPQGNWQANEGELPEVVGRTPQAAAAAFERIDLAVSWRYTYATGADERFGYSECWCVAPPDGTVDDVTVSDPGWAIVFVSRATAITGGRPQPELGWGCEEGA